MLIGGCGGHHHVPSVSASGEFFFLFFDIECQRQRMTRTPVDEAESSAQRSASSVA